MFGINKKTKESKQVNLHEIDRDARGHLVRLKPTSLGERVRGLYLNSRGPFMAWVALFLLLIIVFSYSFFAKADIAKLYSSSCLGDWQGSDLAAGEPSVGKGDSDFTFQNSALLSAQAGRIYCGNFKGDLPEGVQITHVTMHLNTAYTNVSTSEVNEAAVTPEGVIDGNISTTTPEVSTHEEVPATPTEELPQVTPASENPNGSTPGISAPAPSEESPTSFLRASIAYAQESEGAATPDEEAHTVPVEQVDEGAELPVPEATATEEIKETTQETTVVTGETQIDETKPDKVSVAYSLDGNEWEHLGYVTLGAHGDISFDLPQDVRDFEHLQVSIQGDGLVSPERVYLDAMWVEAEYEPIEVSEQVLIKDLPEEIRNLPMREVPSEDVIRLPEFSVNASTTLSETEGKERVFPLSGNFVFRVNLGDQSDDAGSLFVPSVAASNFHARLLEADGLPSAIEPVVTFPNEGEASVSIPALTEARAGRYILEVYIVRNKVAEVSRVSFLLGTLSINISSAPATAFEPVQISLASLDDNGHLLCDPALQLVISSPSGIVHTIATSQTDQGENPNFIKQSESCGPNTYNNDADLSATYIPLETGEYTLVLSNIERNEYITLPLQVAAAAPVLLERKSSVRTTPRAEKEYYMRLFVTPTQDFEGQIIETLPKNMSLVRSPDYEVKRDGAGNWQVVWEKKISAGTRSEFTYGYNPPKKSPASYLIGPLQIASSASSSESYGLSLPWQVNSDDVCLSIDGGGSWSDEVKWSCGHVPEATDKVVIVEGSDMTLDTSSAALASVTIRPNATLEVEDENILSISHTSSGATAFVNNGSFSAGKGTVSIGVDADITPLGGTSGFAEDNGFYNLELAPHLTKERSYVLGASMWPEIAIGGTFTINPNAGLGHTLRVSLESSVKVSPDGLSIIKGSGEGPATAVLSTGYHEFESRHLNIEPPSNIEKVTEEKVENAVAVGTDVVKPFVFVSPGFVESSDEQVLFEPGAGTCSAEPFSVVLPAARKILELTSPNPQFSIAASNHRPLQPYRVTVGLLPRGIHVEMVGDWANDPVLEVSHVGSVAMPHISLSVPIYFDALSGSSQVERTICQFSLVIED